MTPHKEILSIKNKKEEKILRQKAVDFDFSTSTKKEIRELVARMKKIMIEANGIGLAANQIGLNSNMFVAQIHTLKAGRDPTSVQDRKFYAIFNPEIKKFSDEKIPMIEGCLSVPGGIYGEVLRAEKVTLIGLDKNGKKLKIKAWGLLAQIFQHETDHLNGKIFIDKAKNLHKVEDSKNQEQ